MAQIIQAKSLRPGHTFLYKNNIFLVIENSFNKTAMREGIVKCKVKNLRNQAITTEVLTGEKLEQANVMKKLCSFSYTDGNNFVFMDLENFEEYEIDISKLQWEKNFLKEGLEVNIIIFENEILGLSMPDQVILKIEYAEEAVQGNSVQSALKKAVLETGYEINVPQFIKTNENVIINTNNGEYIGRSKNV